MLTLDVLEVFNVTRPSNPDATSNTLFGRRDVDDTVDMGLGWTQRADEAIGSDWFAVFTQGAATLKVQAVNDPDTDGDGIENPVDALPMTFSNDFIDGATTGTITSRGDQTLTIADAPDLADAVVISASPLGGLTPGEVSVDNGTVGIHSLDAGDQVTVAHGSVIVHVLAGSVELTFVSNDGQVGTTSLAEGNGVTFKPESS